MPTIKPQKPIFIFGTGRSGTTIFNTMFSEHPNLYWLSQLCDKYPNKPEYNSRLMQMIDFPILGKILKKKFEASERYSFWDFHCNGFSSIFRDIFSEDVSERNRYKLQKITSQLKTPKRNRLLVKITGWSRIGFLSEIFEDAKFIHVIRDGRAVANSLVNVGFWLGWQGDYKWRWGKLPPNYRKEWEEFEQSFIVLAGIQWKIMMDSYEISKKLVKPENLLEIKYEELCQNPIETFKKVVEFSELNWSSDFEKIINGFNVKNTNEKWKKDLDQKQQRDLSQVLENHLKKYGYL